MGVIRIVIIGAEASGKTTLCEDLSNHYRIPFVPEYARTYLEENGSQYELDDLQFMAQGQLELEDIFEQELQILDTNLYVYKVWLEEKYQTTIEWIEEELNTRHYNHYLLCDFDIPYQEDKLREHPNSEDRQRLFNRYKTLLENDNRPFSIIFGDREDRLQKSISIIESIKK